MKKKLIVEISGAYPNEIDKYLNMGFLYSDIHEAVYYEVYVDNIPIEGQRVNTLDGLKIVEWSQLDLQNSNYYPYRSRIVVVDE